MPCVSRPFPPYDVSRAFYEPNAAMQLRGKSEPDEDEMGSVALVRHGSKIIAGSQDGVLSIFSWGFFNDCSDRFPGAAC